MRDDESETLSSNEMELEEDEILGHLSVRFISGLWSDHWF